jgi:serine/threonine-protein kinase HipA
MDTLNIAMNGIVVGTLCKLKGGGLSFCYETAWLTRKGARAISLSMPLRKSPYEDDRVYNFFDNLLPDNEEIKARIQRRFAAKTKRPFDLLAKIGGDCVGAIQLYPTDAHLEHIQQIQTKQLTDLQISKILTGYQHDAPLGMIEDNEDFRISIAGAQEKTGLLWYQNQWHLPLGSTPTSHILKLPIGELAHQNIDLSQSCENEWLCLHIAQAYGLPVCESEILHFGDSKVLAVERFDRRWSKDNSWLMRLPQEDMCQALGIAPANKYFYSTAKKVGFPEAMVTEIMADMKAKTEAVIEQVTKRLPDDFPTRISQAIFEGLSKQAARLS